MFLSKNKPCGGPFILASIYIFLRGTPFIIMIIVLQFVDIGIVTGIEMNHKPAEKATKGMEVCVKIEPIPGEAPKMYGRHFDETDPLISKVSPHSHQNTKVERMIVSIGKSCYILYCSNKFNWLIKLEVILEIVS